MFAAEHLELIAGDASDRKFYRLKEGHPSKAICMEFPQWEGGFGGDAENWLEMHHALEKAGLPLPKVLGIEKEKCRIWTEDLGDVFLSAVPKSQVLPFYQEALMLLIKAQYPEKKINCSAQKRLFDFQKLYDEMLFFITHFLNGLLKLDIEQDKAEHQDLFTELQTLCQILGNAPRVLCHRDYHSRNIMLKDDHLYWIDFQDARMGPHTYDVVSLIRDSYVDLDWSMRQSLFDFYFKAMNHARKQHKLPVVSLDDHTSELALMGLQRNLKALGSFGYLACSKSKQQFLQYVRPTLKTICSPEALFLSNGPTLDKMFPCLFSLLHHLPLEKNL